LHSGEGAIACDHHSGLENLVRSTIGTTAVVFRLALVITTVTGGLVAVVTIFPAINDVVSATWDNDLSSASRGRIAGIHSTDVVVIANKRCPGTLAFRTNIIFGTGITIVTGAGIGGRNTSKL
jgi:hypothetical protein